MFLDHRIFRLIVLRHAARDGPTRLPPRLGLVQERLHCTMNTPDDVQPVVYVRRGLASRMIRVLRHAFDFVIVRGELLLEFAEHDLLLHSSYC